MEEHYIKDVGKITYVYGVNLEEHKTVIEKQQKRIAELEQDLEFTTKTANDLIEIKHKLEQELAELKEKYNKTNEKLKNITEEIDNNFVHGQDYEKLKQELAELKEKAIVPRFKVNDKLFVIVNNKIEEYYVDEILLRNKGTLVSYRDNVKQTEITEKNDLFTTEQEAQAKLQELRGGE